MLFLNVQSTEKPAKVTVDKLPDGSKIIRLHDEITKVTVPEEDGSSSPSVAYQCREVVFPLPYDRNESVTSITSAFDDWWAYGESASLTEDTPTVEQRLADLEDTVLALLG